MPEDLLCDDILATPFFVQYQDLVPQGFSKGLRDLFFSFAPLIRPFPLLLAGSSYVNCVPEATIPQSTTTTITV